MVRCCIQFQLPVFKDMVPEGSLFQDRPQMRLLRPCLSKGQWLIIEIRDSDVHGLIFAVDRAQKAMQVLAFTPVERSDNSSPVRRHTAGLYCTYQTLPFQYFHWPELTIICTLNYIGRAGSEAGAKSRILLRINIQTMSVPSWWHQQSWFLLF